MLNKQGVEESHKEMQERKRIEFAYSQRMSSAAGTTFTISDARRKFIQEGYRVLEHELALAVGEVPPNGGLTGDVKKHPAILNDLSEMIKQDTEIKKIEAKTTGEVLDAISKGKISIGEARQMVSLLSLIRDNNGDGSPEEKRIIIEIAKGGAV